MAETRHITPESLLEGLQPQIEQIRGDIEARLSEGRAVAVTVATEDEQLSPQAAAARLGFSRQHVRRLIDAGGIVARRLPGSNHWRIPLSSVLAFEEKREAAERIADEHSRALDDLGAPRE